jgi:hypothetical protein
MNLDALRALLSRFGTLRPQPASDWTGDRPLHPDLARFYAEVGPSGDLAATERWRTGLTIPYIGNPVWMPPLAHLWAYQEGYRWSGIPPTRDEAWHDDWLVIADEAIDPFILDRSMGEVLCDYHGEGVWDPFPGFSNLFVMAAWLGARAAVYEEAGGSLNHDFDEGPEWRSQLLLHLAPVMGLSDAEALAVERGW